MFTATIRFGFGGLKQPFTLTRNFAVLAKNIVKNEFIAAATIRLVMKNQATGKSSHDIMTKAEALEVAKSEKLDLILVNGPNEDGIAVCKLDSYTQLVKDTKKKEKEIRTNQKARSLKDVFVGGGIDINDMNTKAKQVKKFLEAGHPVRLTVMAKKAVLQRHATCVEDTSLKMLSLCEGSTSSILLQGSGSVARKDYMLSPKGGNSPSATNKKT